MFRVAGLGWSLVLGSGRRGGLDWSAWHAVLEGWCKIWVFGEDESGLSQDTKDFIQGFSFGDNVWWFTDGVHDGFVFIDFIIEGVLELVLDGLDQEVTDDLWDGISDVSKNNGEICVNSGSHFIDEELFRVDLLLWSIWVSWVSWLFLLLWNEGGSLGHIFEIVGEDVSSFRFDDVFDEVLSDVFFFLEDFIHNIVDIIDNGWESGKDLIDQLGGNAFQVKVDVIQKLQRWVSESLQQWSDEEQEGIH